MCGRYQFSMEESAELREIVRQLGARETDWQAGEIHPTAAAPVLLGDGGTARPALLGWGFPGPQGGRSIINARAETSASRPMFRASLESRRCVVPSSGFYEWDRDKQKYLFRLPGADALYMAGLWSEFDGGRRFCIVTTQANDSIADVHARMPLVLEKREIAAWLGARDHAARLLEAVPPPLSRTAVSAQLRLW